ncbi:MAG: helix-turn-helix transcriptional regulator [Bacteroidales bacterium]|nr:helix-turn-helix transcriptional regulator [Candidatus Cryptobacteroides caccocaballi]
METTAREIELRRLRDFAPANSYPDVSDDFFLANLNFSQSMETLQYPCKFDGYAVLYCVNGNFDIEINLRKYTIQPGSFVIYVPGSIIKVSNVCSENASDFSFVVIAASRSLISDLKIDFSQLYEESIMVLDNPCVILSTRDKELGTKYISLINSLLNSGFTNLMEIVKPVFSSMFLLIASLLSENMSQASPRTDHNHRSKRVFESFLKLVTEHHNEHRYLDYYAEKLCLTPKYLSATVKAVSGRSAPEWIDSFVVVEAKNLLKYSNLDVKEIGFRLNFNAPSVFCRFFKSQTGMTPSEYRNS